VLTKTERKKTISGAVPGKLKYLVCRFSKFGVVGLTGYAVDNGAYLLLSGLVSDVALRTFLVPFISYEIAMCNNFVLSFYWVWGDRRSGNRRFARRLLYYNAATAVPFLIRMAAYVQLFRLLSLEGIFANMIAVLIGMLFNFFICERFIFRSKPAEQAVRNSPPEFRSSPSNEERHT
jgi:putative flippase GtrA